MFPDGVDDAEDLDPEPAYGRPMTLEEWEQVDEGELLDGRLVEEEDPDNVHAFVTSFLVYALATWVERRAIVLPSGAKYALSDRRGCKPDLSVFLTRDRRLPRRGSLRYPPDVAVEVLAPNPRDHRRDRIEKLRDYAAFGVRWYWLVDPEAQTIEVLRLGDDRRYVHILDADEGTVDVPGWEGLTLDLDALWRRIDEVFDYETPPSEP